MNDRFEVLSALIDGEDLDVDHLTAVLSTVDGREALADYLRTRRMVRADDADPLPDMATRLRATIVSRRPRARFAVAAAAVIAMAFLGGWWTGLRRPPPSSDAPPAVTRTLTFERNVDWHVAP